MSRNEHLSEQGFKIDMRINIVEVFTLIGMLAVAVAIPIRQDAKIEQQNTKIDSLEVRHVRDIDDVKNSRKEDRAQQEQQRREILDQFKAMNEKLDRLFLDQGRK